MTLSMSGPDRERQTSLTRVDIQEKTNNGLVSILWSRVRFPSNGYGPIPRRVHIWNSSKFIPIGHVPSQYLLNYVKTFEKVLVPSPAPNPPQIRAERQSSPT